MRSQAGSEDVFRNVEYVFAEWASDPHKNQKILDVGTGYSVFGAYLAKRFGCSLFAMDHDSHCEEFQRSLYCRLRLKNARFIVGDATSTAFASNCFDRVLAVSVVEHFVGNGDSLFVKEACRILRTNGLLIVTVPYSPTYQENEQVVHYHGFERRYDVPALKRRLLAQTDMKLKHQFFINQKTKGWAGQRLSRKYESLNVFFGKWYEYGYHVDLEGFAIFLTKALLDISDKPDTTTCGAMFALEKS